MILKYIKGKIIYVYIVVGIVLFVLFSSLNFFYSKYVIGLDLGYKYIITSKEYRNYKSKSFQNILKYVFKNKLKTRHKIRRVDNEPQGRTLKKNITGLSFLLILDDKFDESLVEKEINDEYLKELNFVLSTLKKNLNLYDYEAIDAEYNKLKNQKIINTFNELINSQFFKKYPPKKCIGDEFFCLNAYNNYYTFIYDNLKSNEKHIIQIILNENKINEDKTLELIQDFNLNRNLYFNDVIKSLKDPSNDREKFFEDKYLAYINSKFNKEYSITTIKSCYNFQFEQCILETYRFVDNLIQIMNVEINNPYKVKFVPSNENKSSNLFFELLKILGFTILITYVLFILTNKFLTKKLK